jgi:hypothetical protein
MSFVDLVYADVEQVIHRFERFHFRFSTHFATQTRNMTTRVRQYLQGQFICQHADNLMAFEKWVPDTDCQSLHHPLGRQTGN